MSSMVDMDSTPKRRCRICKMPLSSYNKANVCFCHKEHPNPFLNGVLSPRTPDMTLREVDYVVMQEYTADPELRHLMFLEWKRRLFS